MAKRKILVDEDDYKRMIIMLKYSRPFLSIPSNDLALLNNWRVANKLVDKLLRRGNMTIEENKGKRVVKDLPNTEENAGC